MLYALLDSLPYLFRIMLYPTVASMQKSCATGRETSGSQRTCKVIPGLLSVLLELDMVTAYWLGLIVIHIHAGALGPLINSRYHVHCTESKHRSIGAAHLKCTGSYSNYQARVALSLARAYDGLRDLYAMHRFCCCLSLRYSCFPALRSGTFGESCELPVICADDGKEAQVRNCHSLR